MQDGTDLVAGAPRELTQRYWPHASVRLGADDHAALDDLARHEGVVAYSRDDAVATVFVDDPDRVPAPVAALTSAAARVSRGEPHEPTLAHLHRAVRPPARRSDRKRLMGGKRVCGRAD